MSALKKGLLWFSAIIFLLLAASVFAATTLIDWNQYRSTLADLTSERLGVRVELARELRMNLLPRPTVVAEGVRLSPLENLSGSTIATAERIDMRLGLAAIFSGNLQLQSLSLEGLSTTIVETDNGWNLEGWPESDAVGEDVDDDTPKRSVSLDRLQISAGTITVKRQSSQTHELSNLNLDLSGSLPDGPLEWVGGVSIQGQNFETSGKLTPTRNGDVAAKLNVNSAGVRLDLSGRVTPARTALGRAVLKVESLAELGKIAVIFSPENKSHLPVLPIEVDLQVDHSGGLTKMVSRRFFIDDSVGQLDLTIAGNAEAPVINGNISLGLLAIDPWLDALDQEASTEDTKKPEANSGVNGAIDLSIESVSMRGNVIQNVEATLGLRNGSIVPQRLQALLPGASRFQYLAQDEKSGSVNFETSRLPQVLAWAGMSLPPEMPVGRLMTARFSTSVAMDNGSWQIETLEGQFDTSTLEGSASGQISPFSLSDISIQIDALNLDAYWPENSFSSSGGQAAGDLAFDLSVANMRFRGNDFADVIVQGSKTGDDIAISSASLRHANGQMRIAGTYSGKAGEETLNATADYSGWQFPLLKAFADSDGASLKLLFETAPYTGELRANGPLSALQTSMRLENDQRELSLVGQIANGEQWQTRLQGTYRDADTMELVSKMGSQFAAPQGAPSKANLSIVLDGPIDQLNYRASGTFLDGQLDLSGQRSLDGLTASVSFIAEQGATGALDSLLASYQGLMPVGVSRQMRADIAYSDESLAVNNMNLRFGAQTVSGNLKYRFADPENPSGISGAVSTGQVNFDRIIDFLAAQPQSAASSSSEVETKLPNGTLQIAMVDSLLKGQKFALQEGMLTLSQSGGVTFDLGAGATMNDAPLIAKMQWDATGGLDTQIDASNFDFGSYAKAFGVSERLISGTAKVTTNLTASGDTLDALLTSLNGQLEVSGTSGSLYFLAAQDLIAAINSASNTTGFLTSIGGLLRSGQTEFASLDGLARIDSGVALVDRLNIGGSWGELSLDGQVNMPADLLSLKGNLSLSNPVGAPPIPVVFDGRLSAPSTRWTSRALERFALAGIERRIRNRIFGDLERAQNSDQSKPLSPGTAILGTAFGFLDKLKKKQEEEKLRREQANSQPSVPEPEKQKP